IENCSKGYVPHHHAASCQQWASSSN
ncbi:unnamed protein product, partial [Rotaria magnacalcarata]